MYCYYNDLQDIQPLTLTFVNCWNSTNKKQIINRADIFSILITLCNTHLQHHISKTDTQFSILSVYFTIQLYNIVIVIVNYVVIEEHSITPVSTCDSSSPEVSRRCTVVPAELVKPPVPRAAWTSPLTWGLEGNRVTDLYSSKKSNNK